MSAGERSEARRADAEARRRVQSCFDRPLILRAGAGTGKTSTLVARVAAWCLGEGWRRAEQRARDKAGAVDRADEVTAESLARDVLSRIAAITFTEAAAGEMAERIALALRNLARGSAVEGLDTPVLGLSSAAEQQERASALSGAVDHLAVRTIHAFSRALLARFPLEARLHPAFEVDADEAVQATVVREVLEEALRLPVSVDDGEEAGPPPSEGDAGPLGELLAAGVSLVEVEELLLSLVQSGAPEDLFAADPLSTERTQRAALTLANAIDTVATFRDSAVRSLSGVAGEVQSALDASRLHIEEAREAPPRTHFGRIAGEIAQCWDERLLKRLRSWSQGEFNQGEAKALGERAADFRGALQALLPALRAFTSLDVERLDLARLAVAPLWQQTCERLRRGGVVPFAGLLSGARDLLVHHADARAVLRAELDQLLVDEFQDTDRLQCEIIRQIGLTGPPASRPGLFLVGDPKQSIYGWRSADLRAYDAFTREVVAEGGEILDLTVNFRSVPAVLSEVERVVEPVMRQEVGLQPGFQPLIACETNLHDEGFAAAERAAVEHWVTWGWEADRSEAIPRLRAAQRAQLEARALAADLRDLREEHGVKLGNVALLLRDLGDLDLYLAELRALGIPYAVERDRSYYRRREIIDASALVRTVLDPNDTLALVTWLRSPSVGVPDAAWIPLFAAGFPARFRALRGRDEARESELETLIEGVARELPRNVPGLERITGWQKSLLAAVAAIAAARASFREDDVDVFVSLLRDVSTIEVTEAARYLGPYRAANLERFFRDLALALTEGGSPQEVLRALRSDVAEGSQAEEEKPAASSDDALRVMTIHRAKGLDFEHVYVMQLHKKNATRPPSPTEIFESGQEVEYALLGTATLGCEQLRFEQKRVEAAERVRTLYVAATRAKRRLVLAGARPERQRAEPERAECHADLLGFRAHPDFAEKMARLAKTEAAGPVRGWLDPERVLWRFPALEVRQEDAAPVARHRDSAPPLDLPAALARGNELASLREQARTRMARPWSLTATAEARECAESLPIAPRSHAPAGSAPARSVAAAAGTLVHRVLEALDLEELDDELASARARLVHWLDPRLPEPLHKPVLERADALLARFAEGPLMNRLASLKERIVARELPFFSRSPDSEEFDSDHGRASAVGFVSGCLDLVYQEEDGRFVVVDFKTDSLEGRGEELAERARAYAGQGRVYVRALGDALALAEEPRFELWFIESGEIVTPRGA